MFETSYTNWVNNASPKSQGLYNEHPNVRHKKPPSNCWSGESKHLQNNIGYCCRLLLPYRI